MGKKILPTVEVVVSRSGSCEPIMARPKGNGLAVPRIREVPAAAIVQCVTLIIDGQEWSYFTSLDLERAIVSYLAHWSL
jgi:hypothetical protein